MREGKIINEESTKIPQIHSFTAHLDTLPSDGFSKNICCSCFSFSCLHRKHSDLCLHLCVNVMHLCKYS